MTQGLYPREESLESVGHTAAILYPETELGESSSQLCGLVPEFIIRRSKTCPASQKRVQRNKFPQPMKVDVNVTLTATCVLDHMVFPLTGPCFTDFSSLHAWYR